MAELNVVIDLSHHNQNLDFARIGTEGGILGVIQNAPQHIGYGLASTLGLSDTGLTRQRAACAFSAASASRNRPATGFRGAERSGAGFAFAGIRIASPKGDVQ